MPPHLSDKYPPRDTRAAADDRGADCQLSCLNFSDLKLVVKECRKKTAKANKSAKCYDINQIEYPAINLPKTIQIFLDGLPFTVRRFFCEDNHDNEGQNHHERSEAIY